MIQIWLIINFVLCLILKISADIYYLKNSKSRSLRDIIFAIGYWQYSLAEKSLNPEGIRIFRLLYKSAQVLWLILFLQVVIMLIIAAFKN